MTPFEQAAEILSSAISSGDIPWEREGLLGPCAPVNAVTGKAYTGINLMLLPAGGSYLTPRQAEEAGLRVREGAPLHTAMFCKRVSRDGGSSDYGVCRTYSLVSSGDVDGAQAPAPDGGAAGKGRDEARRAYMRATGEDVEKGADLRALITAAMRTGLEDGTPGAELSAEMAGAMASVALGLAPGRRKGAQEEYVRRWKAAVEAEPKVLPKAARHAQDAATEFLRAAGRTDGSAWI